MKIALIILAVVAVAVVMYFLIGMIKIRYDFLREHPYVLSKLDDAEKEMLATAYNNALYPKQATFKGGGVWRKEASLEQKWMVGHIRQGRLSETELEVLKRFVLSMYSENSKNKEVQSLMYDLYEKLEQSDHIRY